MQAMIRTATRALLLPVASVALLMGLSACTDKDDGGPGGAGAGGVTGTALGGTAAVGAPINGVCTDVITTFAVVWWMVVY